MKFPTTITILSHEYEIRLEDPAAWSDKYGHMVEGDQVIHINETAHPQQTVNTLMHEIIHAIDAMTTQSLEEKQVNTLATGLVAVFRDNPGLANLFTKKLTPEKK